MAKNDDKKPISVDPLEDMDSAALSEFKQLISDSDNIDAAWKKAILKLIKTSIPQDLKPLEDLLESNNGSMDKKTTS